MFKKTILATATAGLIALGALGAMTSAASAGGYGDSGPGGFQFGGPGWSLQLGLDSGHPNFHPQKICKPVFKKVKWWDRRGHPHWSFVVVGQKCFFQRPYHPRRDGWSNNGGWDNNDQWDNGRGW